MDLIVNNGIDEEILVDFNADDFAEEWQKNSTWSVNFSVTKTKRNAYAFDMMQQESMICLDGQWFVIKQLEPTASGKVLSKSITANHIYFTCQDHRQYNQKSQTWSIEDALHWTFDGNTLGFTWEVVGHFEKVQMDNFGDANALSMVETIISSFNAVLDADNKHLIFYDPDSWGQITNNQFRYLYNTDTVNCQIDTTELKTVIRGYGKQNDDGTYVFPYVTYKSPYVTQWGERHADPIRDDRFTKAESMLAYLKTQLQDTPAVTLSITVKCKEEINKGDHWLLIYEPMNFDTDVEVIGYKKYPFSAYKPPEVTFSNDAKDMTGILSSFNRMGKIVNTAIDKHGNVKTSAITKLPDNKVSVGPGTSFSPGYDPTQLDIPNYSLVTPTSDGLMAAADKQKLDLIVVDTSGNVIVNIPLASVTENGLMSKENFAKLSRIIFSGSDTINLQTVLQTLQDHDNRIAALENGGGA
jgi:hypothetical protein